MEIADVVTNAVQHIKLENSYFRDDRRGSGMQAKIIIGISLGCFILCSGCAIGRQLHYEDDLFDYQSSPSLEKINKVVGLEELLDKRPAGERNKLPPDQLVYQSAPKRITNVLLKDFQESGLFKEIHSPAQPQDDYVIHGSIERFIWEWRDTGYSKFTQTGLVVIFLPFLRLPTLFGAPDKQEYCMVDISLEVKDNKTGRVIANIRESAKASRGISMYTLALGQDVSEAFRSVAEKLKRKLAEAIKSG